MSFLCRMGRHRPSRRSELDLNDLQVKSFCRRCGVIMVREGDKWVVAEHLEAA